jgi:hypothetical protein
MKNFKSILLLVIIISAIFLALFNKKRVIVVDNPDFVFEEKTETEDVSSSPFEREETDLYTIDYGNIKEIADDAPLSDINRYIEDRVSQFKTESGFENFTEEDKEFLGFNRGMKYTLEFDYEIKESSFIKTYILKTVVFTGGAHGNIEILTFNYDKNTGNRISLSDVFNTPASEYLPVLAALGDKFLQSEYPEVGFYEGLAPEPSNWATWYAKEDSLVFIFQTYQVVPYAYGTPEFEVKARGVADFINMKYFNN